MLERYERSQKMSKKYFSNIFSMHILCEYWKIYKKQKNLFKEQKYAFMQIWIHTNM